MSDFDALNHFVVIETENSSIQSPQQGSYLAFIKSKYKSQEIEENNSQIMSEWKREFQKSRNNSNNHQESKSYVKSFNLSSTTSDDEFDEEISLDNSQSCGGNLDGPSIRTDNFCQEEDEAEQSWSQVLLFTSRSDASPRSEKKKKRESKELKSEDPSPSPHSSSPPSLDFRRESKKALPKREEDKDWEEALPPSAFSPPLTPSLSPIRSDADSLLSAYLTQLPAKQQPPSPPSLNPIPPALGWRSPENTARDRERDRDRGRSAGRGERMGGGGDDDVMGFDSEDETVPPSPAPLPLPLSQDLPRILRSQAIPHWEDEDST